LKKFPLKIYVTSIFEDEEGNIWAGTLKEGLWRIKEPYFSTVGEGLDIFSIFENKERSIWIGTKGKGVFLYDYKGFINYKEGFQKKSSFFNNRGKRWFNLGRDKGRVICQ